MTAKPKNSLMLRLKNLFSRKKQENIELKAESVTDNAHTGEGFRPGAAVAFMTPIGAYAGNTEKDALRNRAIEQFHQTHISHHTTIN